MNGQDPLAQLRDIHLPGAVGWWPPAPGWWALAILLLILLALLGLWLWARHRQQAYKREALAQWQIIQARFQQDQDTKTLLDDLAILLKRTCITRHGRELTAGLTGEPWLAFLDQTGRCTAFSQGPGRVLVSQRYSPQPDLDGAALLNVTLAWLNRQ